MRETWYVLEDGNVADPNECSSDDKGVLTHKSGAKVAMRGDVPSSRGVDLDEEGKALAEGGKGKKAKAEGGKGTYQNRESKAD